MLYRNRLVTPILVFALIAFLVGFSKTSDAGSPREKIDGWGGYKFGMSLKDAEKIHADDQLVDCDFGKWAKKCLQREVLLFGEKAQVQALIDAKKNSVRRIDIKFTGIDNFKGKKCVKSLISTFNVLKEVYGEKFKIKEGAEFNDKTSYSIDRTWHPIKGGSVRLLGGCGAYFGIKAVIYNPSATF